jgi:uncharacterized protein YjbI with pentapeptide repeats
MEIGNRDNNWNESESYFHQFNNKSELLSYLNRPEEIWDEEKGRYDFEQCLFNCDLSSFQWVNEFEDNAIFVNANFQSNVSFKGKTFKKIADFRGCNVVNNANFSEVTFIGEYRGGNYNGKVDFHKTKFHEVSEIWGGKFRREIDFSHCHFFKGVDFGDVIFENKVSFHNVTFHGNVFFTGAEFKDKVNAWNLTCGGNITFEWVNFRKKATFSTLKVEKGKANFHGSNFEGNAYFYNSVFKELDLCKSVIDKGVFFLDAKIKKANRETFRIIKHEFIKQNNQIESLKYKELELITKFFEELRNIIPSELSFRNIYNSLKSFSNSILLFVNLISNGFGGSWIVGLIFTTAMMIGSFYLAMKSINYTEFDLSPNNVKLFFQFINPTHKIKDLGITEPSITSCFYIYDFLGRIFIGFGIYQFIQAFRKFGKK